MRNYRMNAKIHNFSTSSHVQCWTTQAQLPNFTFVALYSRRLWCCATFWKCKCGAQDPQNLNAVPDFQIMNSVSSYSQNINATQGFQNVNTARGSHNMNAKSFPKCKRCPKFPNREHCTHFSFSKCECVNHGVYKNGKIKIPDFFQTCFLFFFVNLYNYTGVSKSHLLLSLNARAKSLAISPSHYFV